MKKKLCTAKDHLIGSFVFPFMFGMQNTESSSEEGSIPEERISTPERDGYNLPRDHVGGNIPREPAKLPTQHQSSREVSRDHHKTSSHISERRPQNLPSQPPLSDTSSAGSPPASVHRTQKNSYDMTDISDFQIRPYAAPDITQFNNTRRGADRVTRLVYILILILRDFPDSLI